MEKAKREYTMKIQQKGEYFSSIALKCDNTEDIEVLTNLLMKYGKNITISTEVSNFTESEDK